MSANTTFNDAVTWFFVTNPVVIDGEEYANKPLSPNFRTIEEARRFKLDHQLDTAKICQQGLFIEHEAERHEIEALLFGDANPGIAICYMPENQQT